ncbi:MAG: nucleotide sugar dehydrogenase [Candidatus Nitrosopumilus sp. bin_7KS]
MKSDSLLSSIDNLNAKICVIGLGQVGLPTALTFSKAGFKVIGHDTNNELLNKLNIKKSPFKEEGLESLLEECIEKNKFSTKQKISDAVEESNVVIICVPTPLTENISPDLNALENVCKSLSTLVLKNKLIIIESSIPPGTFTELVIPILTTKLNEIKDFSIAFVPERLSPGQGLTEIQTTPRLIGTLDQNSEVLTKKLYEKIVTSQILSSSVKITEISKLVENTFRDVNVAFANEIGMMCEKYGIDVKELIEVCNSHPRVNLLTPGPGVGGPCLPKDPILLLNPQKGEKYDSKLINQSRQINDSMPKHVVKLLETSLNKTNKKIEESTILILGTAYKGNVSDTRLSPSKNIISQLIEKGANVLVFDPITSETFGGIQIEDIFKSDSIYDVVLVLTDHDEFKKIDLGKLKSKMSDCRIIVDTRRIFDKNKVEDLDIQYISIGYQKQT